jgi:hypothetical protein
VTIQSYFVRPAGDLLLKVRGYGCRSRPTSAFDDAALGVAGHRREPGALTAPRIPQPRARQDEHRRSGGRAAGDDEEHLHHAVWLLQKRQRVPASAPVRHPDDLA